jgi:phosphoglucosamine mutase
MSRRLFGTDGVRGVVGELLSTELALELGRAATSRLETKSPRVLIVRDTRESGPMLEAALAAGVAAAGGEVLLGGVLPTPAAPLLVRRYSLDMAAVISASHNPYADNGIKFFAGDGYKLSDETEMAIEDILASAPALPSAEPPSRAPADARSSPTSPSHSPESPPSNDPPRAPAHGNTRIARIRTLRAAREDYLRELHTRFVHLDLTGLDVVLDCANGATYEVAPEIFRRLGAKVTTIGDSPDGRNINAGCGSTHLDALRELVLEGAHALGFAFDGDGDRMLAVDRNGEVVDGDELIALATLHLREHGRLTGDGVVVTVMTNYGFHAAMDRAGVNVASTQVGDRYVLEELRARGWTLGGEQSGHIIELAFNSTGDGLASALLTLEALHGEDLAERHAMAKLPQRLVNVPVRDRAALAQAETLNAEVAVAEAELAGRGRVLVRPSGTEPLVRVMVEAPTEREADAVCGRLAELVRRELS